MICDQLIFRWMVRDEYNIIYYSVNILNYNNSQWWELHLSTIDRAQTWRRSGRPNATKIQWAHWRARKILTDYNQMITTFQSIYDYITLLKAFNSNAIDFYKYFIEKLSSHEPSQMHYTRHRINSNYNIPHVNRSKNSKMFFVSNNAHLEQRTNNAQTMLMWNSVLTMLKQCSCGTAY